MPYKPYIHRIRKQLCNGIAFRVIILCCLVFLVGSAFIVFHSINITKQPTTINTRQAPIAPIVPPIVVRELPVTKRTTIEDNAPVVIEHAESNVKPNTVVQKPQAILRPMDSQRSINLPSGPEMYSNSFDKLDNVIESLAMDSVLSGSNQNQSPMKKSAFPAKFSFTINIITYNRPNSLKRLCESLAKSNYFGFNVTISFYIESGADQETRDYAEGFVWEHGPKTIHMRYIRGGLVPAVLESWYPAHDHDYVLLAEDDVEVSPHWFQFTLMLLKKYRYSSTFSEIDPKIYGISLYTPRLCENAMPRRLFYPSTYVTDENVYLHQVPCSWGAVYFPQNWKYYRLYVEKRTLLNMNVHIPKSESNGWTGSWVKYYTELNFLKGWYMLYPSFSDEASLSTNHLESGVHIHENDNKHLKKDFEVPLITDQSSIDAMVLPASNQLKIIDYKCDPIADKKGAWRRGALSWRQFLYMLKKSDL